MDETPARRSLSTRLRGVLPAFRDWWAYMTCGHYWHAHDGAIWRCCGCDRDRARPPRWSTQQGVCRCPDTPNPKPRRVYARPTLPEQRSLRTLRHVR